MREGLFKCENTHVMLSQVPWTNLKDIIRHDVEHSRVDKWRHRGGMSCACPGRLEVSRGIVEAKHVTSGRHPSSVVDLTNTNSCQLKSAHVTPTNCSHITSPVSPQTRPETKSPTQTKDSQFQFSQFMKCNFFNLVVATPDAMVNTPLQFLIAHHNTKATNY